MNIPQTPDNLVWDIPSPVRSTTVVGGCLEMSWQDGSHHRFHPFWLRDNCACEKCLHQDTREQLLNILEIPLDLAVLAANSDESGAVAISFSDGHHSRFHPGWLWTHASENWVLAPLKPEPWIADDLVEPPTFEGPEVTADPAAMAECLRTFEKYGIVRLRDLPTVPGTVEEFALSMGPIRETQFERIFNVCSRADADSNAYTSAALSGHVDLPTWEATPGIQILHCLENTAIGGNSVMIDGFAIASDLRESEPEIFHILSTICWSFSSRKLDTGYRWRSPVIELDRDGEIHNIRMTAFSRDPLQVAPELVEPAYRALRRFLEMTEEDQYRLVYPFSPGDLVMFDNLRILHGREEYDPGSGDRHLQGIYIDRDSAIARRRVIEQQQLRQQFNANQ